MNLCTDAPKHNLVLMKISTYHKAQGDQVYLNGVGKFDLSYGSWLFDFSEKVPCDIEGGPYYVSLRMRSGQCSNVCGDREMEVARRLPDEFNRMAPDYQLYNNRYSLGYTWSWCPRNCSFCVVPRMGEIKEHHSIWDFHDSKFNEICLLNNNTFSDPDWKETFEEIWDANLTVRDENGYDLRLMDEEKAEALRRTKWATPIHFAWDRMEDEKQIRNGLKLLSEHHLKTTSNGVYVLIGFDTTEEEDIYRFQVINDFGLTPYPMPYKRTKRIMALKRFINLHYYRKYRTIAEAWKDYGRSS